MMYVDVTRDHEVNLMGMTQVEAAGLAAMIECANLPERRTFNHVLRQLKQHIDKLMKQ